MEASTVSCIQSHFYWLIVVYVFVNNSTSWAYITWKENKKYSLVLERPLHNLYTLLSLCNSTQAYVLTPKYIIDCMLLFDHKTYM